MKSFWWHRLSSLGAAPGPPEFNALGESGGAENRKAEPIRPCPSVIHLVCSPKTGPFKMREFCEEERSGKEDYLDETVPVY
jgi:hypothetical protein